MIRHEFRTAFAVGAHDVFRRGPQRTRAVHVFLATLALALVLIGMAVAASVFSGIATRDAVRAPLTTPGQQETPIGYLLDTFSPPPLNVVLVQPKGSMEAYPPPGLPRWPGRGEAFVSPEVSRTYPVGAVSPWGAVVGVIGDGGLVNPNEQYVYANPARYSIPPVDGAAVYGWGAGVGFQGDHRSNHPVGQFLTVMTIVLLVPALFLVHVTTRLRSDRTRRNLAVFDGIGAPRRFRAVVAVASVAAPVAAACLTSALLVGALQIPAIVTFSPLHLVLQGADLRAAMSDMAWAIVISGATTTASAVWNVRRKTRTRRAPNLVERAERSRGLIALAAPVALVALVQVPSWTLPVEVLAALASILVLTFLLSIPFLASAITNAVSLIVLRSAGSVGAIVAGRWMRAAARTTEIIGFAVVLSMSLFGLLQLFGGFYGQQTLDGLSANRDVAKSLVVVRAPLHPAWTARAVLDRLGNEDVTALPVDDGEDGSVGGEPVLTGTCAQFAVLGAQRCDSSATTIAQLAGGRKLDTVASFLTTRIKVTDDISGGTAVRFILATRDDRPIDMESLTTRTFPDQLRLAQVGDEWAGNAAFQQQQLRWLSAFLWPGTAIFMAGLVLASAESLTSRLAALTPLAVMTDRRTLQWVASGASLLIPLITAVLSGTIAYLMLGGAMGMLYEGLRLSGADGLHMAGVGLVTSIAGWIMLTRLALEPDRVGTASFEGRTL